jgi:choline dehydrogenase
MQYMLVRTGPLTLAASQVAIFTRSGPDVTRPGHPVPHAAAECRQAGRRRAPLLRLHLVGLPVAPLQPRPHRDPLGRCARLPGDPSRLSVGRARSSGGDRRHQGRAPHRAGTRRMAPHILSEFVPGAQFQTDAELLDAARRYSQTIYHPTGTCKMGIDPWRWSIRGCGCMASPACAWSMLDHAGDRLRQHQRADHHDRRKGRRHDSRGCLSQ